MLEVQSLSASYGGIRALNEVSISVDRGEVVAVLGPNGAGKSTLLRTIAGHNRAQNGTVILNGRTVTGMRAHQLARLGLAFVAEGHKTLTGLSVDDNLRMAALCPAASKSDTAPTIAQILEIFPQLSDRRKQDSSSLSGGERQMLGLAMALLTAPDLILLDEPSLGLAPIIIRTVYEHVATLSGMGMGVLLVEHHAHAALSVANRAYILSRGSIAVEGTAQEIRENPALFAAYLGE